MSDDQVQTPEAAGSDSAPASGDEVTSIIESAASGLSAAEPTSAAVAPEGPPAGAAEPPPGSPSAAEDAELQAIEQELVAKNASLKSGQMAMSRHQAVLTRRARQYEAAMAEAARRLKQYESPEMVERLRAFQIAEQNPDQFLQVLQAIPDYRERIDALIEQAVAARTAQVAPEAEVEQEPQPDTLLEGGGMGYSTERANQLWEYRLRQARQEYDQKLAALEEGLQPIKQERQTREVIEQAYVRTGNLLKDARATWPLFAKYEPAIRAELSKPGHERMQLDQAYRLVVVQAEQADRARLETEVRAKIQQELNGRANAPRSLRPGLPPAETAKQDGDGEVEAIIRNAYRSLG